MESGVKKVELIVIVLKHCKKKNPFPFSSILFSLLCFSLRNSLINDK